MYLARTDALNISQQETISVSEKPSSGNRVYLLSKVGLPSAVINQSQVAADGSQPPVSVVSTQQQAILRTAGQHPTQQLHSGQGIAARVVEPVL